MNSRLQLLEKQNESRNKPDTNLPVEDGISGPEVQPSSSQIPHSATAAMMMSSAAPVGEFMGMLTEADDGASDSVVITRVERPICEAAPPQSKSPVFKVPNQPMARQRFEDDRCIPQSKRPKIAQVAPSAAIPPPAHAHFAARIKPPTDLEEVPNPFDPLQHLKYIPAEVVADVLTETLNRVVPAVYWRALDWGVACATIFGKPPKPTKPNMPDDVFRIQVSGNSTELGVFGNWVRSAIQVLPIRYTANAPRKVWEQTTGRAPHTYRN